MNNEKQQTAVEWLVSQQKHNQFFYIETIEQAKEMQQEQAQLYATFVLMCVNNNLPPITFNDWVGNIRR
jgi:hypothetical protein